MDRPSQCRLGAGINTKDRWTLTPDKQTHVHARSGQRCDQYRAFPSKADQNQGHARVLNVRRRPQRDLPDTDLASLHNDVRRQTLSHLGGLRVHLGKCRVRMDRQGKIVDRGSEFDR
jgi:hypothetical protein